MQGIIQGCESQEAGFIGGYVWEQRTQKSKIYSRWWLSTTEKNKTPKGNIILGKCCNFEYNVQRNLQEKVTFKPPKVGRR